MKDSEARKQITQLEKSLEERTKGTANLVVGYCPKCKHETIQNTITVYDLWGGTLSEKYICLVCGATLKKERVEVIEETKKNE